MGRLLTTLVLCSQLAWTTVAQRPSQQPAPWPPPLPEAPSRPKPATQKPPQTTQPTRDDDLDIVKITTNLVQVDAIVTDDNGKLVTDLRSSEVEMLEDGKARSITNLSYISLGPKKSESTSERRSANNNAPPVPLRPEQTRRTIAMVVDDLGLTFESATYVRRSLKKFVDEQIGPNDLVAIIRSGSGIGALQQFTTDKRQLYAAIERVRWNPFSPANAATASFSPFGSGGRIAGPNDDMREPGKINVEQFKQEVYTVGTLGALSYVIRGLRELPGRKSIVLFSDGFQLLSSKEPFNSTRILSALHRLTDLANRASVVIYTVHAMGLQTLGINAADHIEANGGRELEVALSDRRKAFYDSQDGLEYLANRTGGLAFRNSNDLSLSVKRIVADQEGYYLIGYRPDDSTFNQPNSEIKFHDISLKIKRPGKYKVRMRNGFYGVSDEQIATVAQTPQQQLASALTSPFGASGVQLRLTSLFVNDPTMGSAMHSFLHVNARDIDFTEEPDGMHKAEVDLIVFTFGDNGQVVDQLSYAQVLRIKKENFARALKNGFTYNLTIPIKQPGAYQFRTALRDKSSGRIGSASQFIEVPDIKKNKLLVSGIVMKGMTLDDYLKVPSALAEVEKPNTIVGDTLPNASSAVRQFQNGLALAYGFKIYNAQLDQQTAKPKLKVQVRVFQNGVELFTGEEIPYDASGQTDLKRLTVNGGIQLGANMSPGDYVLQVIVTDLVKEKPQVASQWLDFEIVK